MFNRKIVVSLVGSLLFAFVCSLLYSQLHLTMFEAFAGFFFIAVVSFMLIFQLSAVGAPAKRIHATAGKVAKSREKDKSSQPVGSGEYHTGEVKWFDVKKGYGFILSDDGAQIFVHKRSIVDPGYRVNRGDMVRFVIANADKGPQALEVSQVE